jgi:hypothetical protein
LGQVISKIFGDTHGLSRVFRQAAFHISRDGPDHVFHMLGLLKEVIRTFQFFMGDGDTLLLVQLVYQRVGIRWRRNSVCRAVDDQA